MTRQTNTNQTELINNTAKYLSEMKDGKLDAFDSLYQLTNSYVQWAVRMHLNSDHDWEDVVQEVYITIYDKCDQIKDPQAGLKWIKTIAFNKASDRNRRSMKNGYGNIEELVADPSEHIDDNDSVPMPDDILLNSESRDIVRNVIKELKPVQRDAIICHYYNGMSVKEMSAAMNIPEGTVKTALSRGRNEMKRKLSDYEKKGFFKLLAVPGAVTFIAFMHADAEAMAAELPVVQNSLHKEALKVIKDEAGKNTAATMGDKISTAGGIFSGKLIPIIIAIAVAAAAVAGGVYAHNKSKQKPVPPAISEESVAQAEPPIETQEPSEDLTQEDLYGLYLDKLIEIQNQYAPGQEFYNEGDVITPDVAKGVVFAKLIDFNKDGVNELVVVYTDGSVLGFGETNDYSINIWSKKDNNISKVYEGQANSGFYSEFVATWDEGDEIRLISGNEPHDANIAGYEVKEYQFNGDSFNELHTYGCTYEGEMGMLKESDIHPAIDGVSTAYDEVAQAIFDRLGSSGDPKSIRYNIANDGAEDWMLGKYVCVDQDSLSNLWETLVTLGKRQNVQTGSNVLSEDSEIQASIEDAQKLKQVNQELQGLWATNGGWNRPILVNFEGDYAYYYEPYFDGDDKGKYGDPRKTRVTLQRFPSNPLAIIDVNVGEEVELEQTNEDGRSLSGTVIYIDGKAVYWFPDEKAEDEDVTIIECYTDGRANSRNSLLNEYTKGYTAEDFISEELSAQ